MTGIATIAIILILALAAMAVAYLCGHSNGWAGASKSHMSWRKDRAEMDLLHFKSGDIGNVLEGRVKSHNPTTLDELKKVTSALESK